MRRGSTLQGNVSVRSMDVATVALRATLERKRKELRWRSNTEYGVRLTMAWTFNFFIIGLGLLLGIIFGAKFGEETTRKMVIAWLFAYGVTFAIVEPVQVIALAALPMLNDEDTRCGRACLRCRFIYNELMAP